MQAQIATPVSGTAATLIGAAIGLVAASFGVWFSSGRARRPYRGSAVGTLTAGILVGIALLSMLPEAIDELAVHDWRTSSVLLLCLVSVGAIFILENVVMSHEHATSMPTAAELDGASEASADESFDSGASTTAGSAEPTPPPPATRLPAKSVAAPATDSAAAPAAVDVELAQAPTIELTCMACDELEEGETPPKQEEEANTPAAPPPKKRPKALLRRPKKAPWASAEGRADKQNWWQLDGDVGPCDCCDEKSAGAGFDHEEGAGTTAFATGTPSSTSRTASIAFLRQLAWLLHAAIDGMVLAAIPSYRLLAAGAFAVLVCALQDAVAFSIVLARARTSRHGALLALGLFGCAFPLGAGLASSLLSALRGSEAIAVTRVMMSAMFLYMASELAPSHTHSRRLNLLYVVLFGLGVTVSSLAELFESVAQTQQVAPDGPGSAGVGAAGATLLRYTLDTTAWQPRLPPGCHMFSAVGVAHLGGGMLPSEPPPTSVVYISQRGNVSLPPLMVLNATDGSLLFSFGRTQIAADPASSTWGSHGLAVETCASPCVAGPSAALASTVRVYVQDFTNHTLVGFGGDGRHLFTSGTPGRPGNGTVPVLQFGSVADAAIAPGGVRPGGVVAPTTVWASDGDGGSANRVVQLMVRPDNTGVDFGWATPAIFDNPHSVAWHARSGMLVVANREGAELRLLRASDGTDLGAWTQCGLGFGAFGVPFGVRTLHTHSGRDLLFVSSYDNPADPPGTDAHARITVIDAAGLDGGAGAHSPCTVLQTLTIDPALFSGPHLLGVDEFTGDLYAALVADAPRSTVLRFTCTGCR